MFYFNIVLSLAIFLPKLLGKLSCLDQNSKEVSWFVVINFPKKVIDTQNPEGKKYFAYFDSNRVQNYFELFNFDIDNVNSPVYKTINNINNEENAQTLAFNDDKPHSRKSASNRAHAKAIMSIKDDNGLYLGHSFPNFPEVINNSKLDPIIPETASKYGQSMICISLNAENFENLARDIVYEKPNIYYKFNIDNKYPNFQRLSQNPRRKRSDPTRVISEIQLEFSDEKVILFTKSAKSGELLLDDMIFPYFKCSLEVETWGRPLIKSMCFVDHTQKFIKNNKKLKFQDGIEWTINQDHSKWAVCKNIAVACIGDMNNMESQRKRGGSFFCLKSIPLKSALINIISELSSC